MSPEGAACSVLTELTNEENARDAAYKVNIPPLARTAPQHHFSPFWGPLEAEGE